MKKFFKKNFVSDNHKEHEDESLPKAELVNREEIYSADNPISNPKLDEFNRREFSERIAQTIAARKETNGLVIGIYGKWGEGKTTILNFIDNELKRQSNVITFKFNPWMFPSETELIVAFYTELAKTLKKSLPTVKEKIGKVIGDYLTPILSLVDKADFADKIGKLLSTVSLEELRDRIGKFLIEQKKLVVIFIDDIDRLDKGEIQAVFRLIKLSASFENVVYVLAFDREIVEEALGQRYFSKQGSAGQNFLEKIVQVPINLPKIQKTDLRKFCIDRINKVLSQVEIQISDDDAREFLRGFAEGIEIKLDTPRMAIRYINMLNFSLPLVKGEVNTANFLLIEAIRAFYPDAYELIKGNRDTFTGVGLGGMDSFPSKKEEMKKIVDRAFIDLNDEEKNNLNNLLTILFPRLKTIFGNTIYPPEWDRTWTEQKRIASQYYFERYFSYSIPTGDVSDNLIENFIQQLENIGSGDLIELLTNILSEQNAESCVSKIQQKLALISPVGKIKLAKILSTLGNKFPNTEGLSKFTTPFSRAALLIARLIESLPDSVNKVDLATQIINISEPIFFGISIIRWFRKRKVETENETLSPEDILRISTALAARIETLATQGIDFFDHYPDNALDLMWFWNKYGSKEKVDQYLTRLLNSNIQNVHRLLNSAVPISYPMDGSLPYKGEFEREQYNYLQSFVNLDMINKILVKNYKETLESEQYPNDNDKPLDMRIARQFAWIHKFVLNERKGSEDKTPPEIKTPSGV